MNLEDRPDALVIHLPHPILSTNVVEFRSLLSAHFCSSPKCPAVEVDLTGCPAIDSSGLNLLASLYRESVQRKIPFKVTNPSSDILRLLTFLKLTERFGLTPHPADK
ncbi:MAG: STAS domain-containing protein [Verrucomicrobiae bacterium]